MTLEVERSIDVVFAKEDNRPGLLACVMRRTSPRLSALSTKTSRVQLLSEKRFGEAPCRSIHHESPASLRTAFNYIAAWQ